MRKRTLAAVCAAMLTVPAALTGCTDIRGRVSPDVLAVDQAESVVFSARITESDRVLTAEGLTPLHYPTALENAAGGTLSHGHLALLLANGDPVSLADAYFQRGWIPPGCALLYVPEPDLERAPTADQLNAAVRTGQLPPRSAGAVLGDRRVGSGVTGVHAWDGCRLSVALFAEGEAPVWLSAEAARGLALLDGKWKEFPLPHGRVTRARLKLTAEAPLRFRVTGSVTVEDAPDDEVLSLLAAALTETTAAGADLLLLRERALLAHVPGVRECTQDEWRTMLQGAEIIVDAEILHEHTE